MLTVFYSKYKNIIVMAIIGIFLFSSALWAMADHVGGSVEFLEDDGPENMRADTRVGEKDLTFYFHESLSASYIFDYSTTSIINTMVGDNQTRLADWGTVSGSWYLHPVLPGDFHISGDVSLAMNVNMSSESNNRNGNFNLELFDVSDVSIIGERSETGIPGASGNDGKTFDTSIATYGLTLSGIDYTVPAGHTIRVKFSVSGGAGNYYNIWYGDDLRDSHITISSLSYVEVNNIQTVDYKGEVKNNFELEVSDKSIEMRANITDPFGGYDIKMVNFTLVSPSGSVLMDNVSMIKYEGTNNSFVSKYFKGWNYSGAETGRYNVSVWVVDHNGYNYYYHRLNYNFGDHYETGTGYFFVGGQPLFGTVTVHDSMGAPLEGAVVKASLGGVTKSSDITDTAGIAQISGYPGLYVITVEWQDVIVKTVNDLDIKDDLPVTLTCDVFYPEFIIVDNNGAPLKGASVYISHPNGTFIIAPFITDENGSISLDKAPIGNYQIIVKWRDVEVANTNPLVDKNGLIATITCKVYTVQLTVVDSKGIGLQKAQIVIADDTSKLIMDSQISSIAGFISSQLPTGDYTISVYWLNTPVKEFQVSLNNDYTDTIVCDVFYVNFIVLDTHQQPVDNAVVFITDQETDAFFDSNASDDQGLIESRLPGGAANLKVYWKNVLVNRSTITVTGDAPASKALPLNSEIYYLTLNCLDKHGIPIENAYVEMFPASEVESVDSGSTGPNGTLIFRLPVSSYDMTVFWLDIEVYNRLNYALVEDSELDLFCSVYYTNITPVDSADRPLENARIDICDQNSGDVLRTSVVAQNGKALFRLPSSTYLVKVYWFDINVIESTQSFVQDADVKIVCNVFYLTISVSDVSGVPVEYANVVIDYINTGNTFDSNITGASGKIVSRLPIGTYSISVTWRDVEVYITENVSLVSDKTWLCPSKIYYLDIKSYDKNNELLKDVMVSIENLDTNPALGDAAYTNSKGYLQFRLPFGTYQVNGRLIRTYLLEDIDNKVTQEVDLKNNSVEIKLVFSEYPPPVYTTPAFAFATFVILVIIIFTLIWLFLIRKLKKRLKDLGDGEVSPRLEKERPEEPSILEKGTKEEEALDESHPGTLDSDESKEELPPKETEQAQLPPGEDNVIENIGDLSPGENGF